MTTVTFYNPGEIDMRAVTTFGLSVKETDNPIGFFGTGLKYAIAVILREGCDLEILTGGDRYTFHATTDQFRGSAFKAVMMAKSGEAPIALPFTLELGKTWKLWQAYRELYCNAIDEGGGVRTANMLADGLTLVVVKGNQFKQVHAQKNAFINTDHPIYASGGVDIVPTPGVFLKGIRVSDTIYYRPIFGYRFHDDISLTEDRTLKYPHQAEAQVREALGVCDDYNLVQQILTAENGTFEEQIAWDTSSFAPVGETFKRVLFDLARNRPNQISSSARSLAKRLDATVAAPVTMELDAVQAATFNRAKTFLSRHDVRIDDYPVVFVESLGDNIWGQATSGTIFIARQCFDFGTKCLAATLYEEHLHLLKGYSDMSRQMQNHLFHTVIGAWEQLDGEAI